MNVTFDQQVDIKWIEEDKSYNFNEEYSKRHINRVLYKMECYFRTHDLLEKNEMLEIKHHPQKHIRSPFIDCIAYKNKWIYPDEYVHIL